ncbi:MAG: Txe/YoeB family addiction module toxin [Actinobacteria bacterium]|nr:Txe/YoeB family addiction module toxin [Actinomycetota bacterium]
MSYRLAFSTRARRDAKKLARSGLREGAEALIVVIQSDPYQNPPPYEKLVGDLKGCYSRRINIQHRLIYDVLEEERTVRVLSMWTHYE